MNSQSPPLGEPFFSLHRHLDGEVADDLFELFVFLLNFVVLEDTDGTRSFGAEPVVYSAGMDAIVGCSVCDT